MSTSSSPSTLVPSLPGSSNTKICALAVLSDSDVGHLHRPLRGGATHSSFVWIHEDGARTGG